MSAPLPPIVKQVLKLTERAITDAHATVFRATDGRVLNRISGMPVLMLTTIGRTSGERRTVMLTAPVRDGERLVIVASRGGAPRHPGWFLNLRANPSVEVTMAGWKRTMRARVATSEERARLWPQVVGAYRGYEQYQRRTSRQIPLVILEPASST
ncbi:MAG: nitroreductase family deazaflavin-dependent oxidoreductase [Acidimicrobiales bacterium]